MQTLNEEWRSYVQFVYPEGLSSDGVQHRECRRAFIAGASAMFRLMNEAAENEEDIAVKEMEKLRQEIKQFAMKVSVGLK